mgnify:CR=1 FL=1
MRLAVEELSDPLSCFFFARRRSVDKLLSREPIEFLGCDNIDWDWDCDWEVLRLEVDDEEEEEEEDVVRKE